MSTGNIRLDTVKPTEYMRPQHVSTSHNITKKQRMRFLPNSQVTYSPDANGIIEFDVHDPTSFLLLPESYFVFDIYRSDTATAYNYHASLDCGGFDACVRNYEVYAKSSNTRIHQLQSYNRMYALMRNFHVDRTSLPMFHNKRGDSDHYHVPEWRQYAFNCQLESKTDAAIAGEKITYTLSSGTTLYEFIKVGDTVMTKSSKTTRVGTVTAISISGSNVVIEIQCSATPTDAELKTTYINVYKLCNAEVYDADNISGSHDGAYGRLAVPYLPERFRCVRYNNSANKVRVIWNPFSSFHTKNFPLFAIRMGFRFRIELERGGRAIKTGLPPTLSTTEPTYSIENPRFVGMLSSPDASIAKEVLSEWNSPMGLLYYTPSYKYREVNQATIDSTTTTLNLHYGVRSAKGLAITINDEDMSNGNNALQYASYSLSTNLRDGITYYQVQVGANQYPIERAETIQPGATSVRDIDMNENLNDLYYWSFVKNPTVLKEMYQERTYTYIKSSDNSITSLPVSTSFCLYRDLSRSITADNLLCGLDVSQVPLQVKVEREKKHGADYGYQSNVVWRSYLFHDAFTRIGAQITTTLE
jgi:hypothetical protein